MRGGPWDCCKHPAVWRAAFRSETVPVLGTLAAVGVKERPQPTAGASPVLLGDVRCPASEPAPLPHSPGGSRQAAGV